MAPLSVDAAEKFLLSIPLLYLGDDAPTRLLTASRLLERQVSPSSSLLGGTAPEDLSSERATGSKEIPIVAGIGLDVARAECFLTSLEVDAPDQEELQEGRGGGAQQALHNASGTQGELRGDEPAGEWHTVVGGWRSRHDLDRLAPSLIRKGLLGGRMILSERQTTSYICSTRPPCVDTSGTDVKDVPLAKVRLGRRPPPWQLWPRRPEKSSKVAGTSYARYLAPSAGADYDPDFLDDQSLRQGKHHTVLRLEAYHVSVIPFVRPRRLKEELNDQFRIWHPGIHPSITLSKLRNLQKDLREITLGISELDASTVALAWVYFEKLVLGDFVRKWNRKVLAGACLVLAFKFNQHGDRATLRQLAACIRKLDRKDQLNLTALHDAELKAFVWLEFSLHVSREAFGPHLQRLLKDLGTNVGEYYGGP
eukprot:CAMPEP_0168357632 /NCGR_PEP_ID=MMETSP0228-20121227/692_1 /TAXON_ID=133427 /ORGANISM="Protoceratium reticulatum, Strain CCCM 535 (=CCMP 1889)" /LENGTH=422 /DNA_ID=CAMNT_0008370167 /DNA_START=83 /DNA_END=1347 /DNA_ORIENTATION=-